MRWPGRLGGGRAAVRLPTGLYDWMAEPAGLRFRRHSVEGASTDGIVRALTSPAIAALLDQLAGEDLATPEDGGEYFLGWEQVHTLARSRAYATSLALLELPLAVTLSPRLASHGSLTDPHFAIAIAGWVDGHGSPITVEALSGSVVRFGGQLGLLSTATWRLMAALDVFADRPSGERCAAATRRHWGNIRRLAVEADAILDDFLIRSVVVTPDKLDIEFRRARIGGTNVVEIAPGFADAPERWLELFDKMPSVPEHINIPTPTGVVHVAFSEPVRNVLREIKRLPDRRAAGARAEAFMLNPFAALGEDATAAIDAEQFTAARARAGIEFDRFRPIVVADPSGRPVGVGIEIAMHCGETEQRMFAWDDELRTFTDALAQRLERGQQLLAWQEYELELDGDARGHLETLRSALEMRTKPLVLVRRDSVFDLSTYSDRVVGIGESEQFVSTYIASNTKQDWFEKDLLHLIWVRPEGKTTEVALPLTAESVPNIQARIEDAKKVGRETIMLDGFPEPVPIKQLESVLANLVSVTKSSSSGVNNSATEQEASIKQRPSLLIRSNINALDHQEAREQLLAMAEGPLELPSSLKPSVTLRDHQIEGVRRLQRLFKASPARCRGMLLADDMGLGKTLQLLTFIVGAFECDASLPPTLIVAPVSLLQNWQEEIERFFQTGAIRLLLAYGDALAKLRVPRSNIDSELQKEGLVRFLKPGWRGDAQIVLTTYETLRDLEFSFAQEPWSILVCDEAQKIKNPNAMVTRAAKKLNVRFRVACTGTPVENSLADLWCLFDLIQPGLLGPLNEFGRRYGRTIEEGIGAPSTELEALRKLIEPQVIRRTKAEVAKDLPAKIKVAGCRMAMSNEQRALYVGALQEYNRVSLEEGAGLHHLALLQYLRLVCADPREHGIETFVPDEPTRYRRIAPKMDWLLRTLDDIRRRDESKGRKVLVFAEARDVQRLLQHYIHAEFGIQPRIVNGDTNVSPKAADNRQRIIEEFQTTPGFGVLILSPVAVGFGVNIQAANHVIHYLRHWNHAKEDQATDRAYRIGQTRDVLVYCPLTIATDFKTFDVKLDELLSRKRALADDMLRAAGDLSGAEFDLEEIVPDGASTLHRKPITSENVERLTPQLFEALAAVLWERQGYRCRLTPVSSDAGVDVIGIRGNEGVLIQCKSSPNPDRSLGWDAIKEVVGGTAVVQEQFPTVRFSRIGLTNQRFNKNAHDRARANDVELVERDALVRLIIQHPLDLSDLLSKLADRRS